MPWRLAVTEGKPRIEAFPYGFLDSILQANPRPLNFAGKMVGDRFHEPRLGLHRLAHSPARDAQEAAVRQGDGVAVDRRRRRLNFPPGLRRPWRALHDRGPAVRIGTREVYAAGLTT